MDFEQYYKNQIKDPVFRGSIYQRGHGFGDVFKKFFSWILPIVKQHASPIAKTVGQEALKSAVNIATDTLDGKNFGDSSKSRLKESLNNLSVKYGNGKIRKRRRKKKRVIHDGIKIKKVYKKKRKSKKRSRKQKRKLDIFD